MTIAKGATQRARVAVAMSGGVDSSVAAYLLHRQGYDVVGMSMHLYNLDLPDTTKFDTCCSLEDLDQARRVADDLGFPHFIVDYTVSFEKAVVKPFIASYAAGETPNPCVWCNDRVKFQPLLEHAAKLGCQYLATGHYAKVEHRPDGSVALLRPKDRHKDQTYFLFSLGAEQLRKTLFPLGDLTKDDVRAIALEAGMVNAKKPESQDICFIPDGDVGKFLEAEIADVRPGKIVDTGGNVVGDHPGIHRYTIGQRRGLGIAAPEPLYVSEIRPDRDEVVVGPRDDLRRRGLFVRDVRWVGDRPGGDVDAEVQVRYRSRPAAATIVPHGASAEVRFAPGVSEVVSPGQAVVFYRGDEVLGGGWIERAAHG